MEWLVRYDEYMKCPCGANLVKRFVIALFYFFISGNEWLVKNKFLSGWHECSCLVCYSTILDFHISVRARPILSLSQCHVDLAYRANCSHSYRYVKSLGYDAQ